MNGSPRLDRRDEQGSILLVLLVMVCLGSIVMSSLWVASMEWTLSATNAQNLQAFAAAESGLDHAFAVIDDGDIDFTEHLAGPDGKSGTEDDGRLFVAAVALGDATYDVIMTDNDDGDGDLMTDTDGVVYLSSTGVRDNTRKETWLELSTDGSDLATLAWREDQS